VRELETPAARAAGVFFMSHFYDHEVEACPFSIAWATMDKWASGVTASHVEELCVVVGDEPFIPFSQREGFSPLPAQLKLGEVSNEFRRLIDYYVGLEVERVTFSGNIRGEWVRVAQDFHVHFCKRNANEFHSRASMLRVEVESITEKARFEVLFDFVEFFLRHPRCSDELREDLASAFKTARAAYRVVDNQVVAIGTDEQAAAYEAAVQATEDTGAKAARQHLVAAGSALRHDDWAGSIRESIHAVEAMVRMIAPDEKTLGPALSELEKRGHLHAGLKKAFTVLYGYSSDEEGVRHALVFNENPKVDEADALFMLGACASFVSYLIARTVEL